MSSCAQPSPPAQQNTPPHTTAATTATATDEASSCLPQVSAAVVRIPPAQTPVHGGYMTVTNPCAQTVHITAASSPHYQSIELHETTHENGISKMRAVAALELPAGQTIQLQPGGLHLMLMHPNQNHGSHAAVPVQLHLADGRVIAVTLSPQTTTAVPHTDTAHSAQHGH